MSDAGKTRTPPFRQLAAVAVGNSLEFYDFLVFSFFATQIGEAFFPKYDAYGRLLLTLATFGVGFLTRPLGALLIGRLGDRRGRKPAMLLSFGLMGSSILGLALTPSYSKIGIAAPLLALLFRLAQGFSLGGEVGPSTAFMLETAPPASRGFYIAFQHSTQYLAILLAGLVGTALANAMSETALFEWGWRVAFLIGTAVVPYGLWLRSGLTETLIEQRRVSPRYSYSDWKVGMLGLFMLACTSISIYVVAYMNTYAINTLGFPARFAFSATVASGLCGICFALLGGWLSDRFGRKPIMIGAALGLLISAIPAFMAMSTWRTPAMLVVGSGLITALLAMCGPSVLATISENLPLILRGTILGLVYALANAIFGGTTQVIVTWLIHAQR